MKTDVNKNVFYSFSSMLLSVPLLLLSRGYHNSEALLMVIGVSMQPLLARFGRRERFYPVMVAFSIGMALGFGTLVFHGFFDAHPQLCALLCCLAVVVPSAFRIISVGISMASDIDYLCDSGYGWENTLYYSNVMVASSAVFLYLTLACVCSVNGGSMDLVGIVCVTTMLAGFVGLVIRYMSGYGSGSPKAARWRLGAQMRAIMGNAKGRDVNIHYKMLYGRIREYMDEKRPYLNPSFGLEDMAKAMYTNSGYVSRMINVCTGSNFSQFVNGYRVRHAMDLFTKDPGLKMTELAQLSGFNNKVTFNMAFKLVTDETPGLWCRHYLESMQQAKDLSSRKEQHR